MTIRQSIGLNRSRGEAAAAALTGIVTGLQREDAVTAALARHGIEGARAAGPGD